MRETETAVSPRVRRGLHAADSVLCLLVFFPSMVFFWRGIWDLYGVYILPGRVPEGDWAIVGLGCGSVVGYLLLPVLDTYIPRLPRVPREILTRVYLFAYSVVYMAYWRGVWGAADHYLNPLGWLSGLVGFFVTYPLLLLLRASRTAIFPPFLTALDTREDILRASTRFGVQPRMSDPMTVPLYVLDSLFTHFIISTLTILLWRSLWVITDVILVFPDPAKADWVSLLVGLGASALLFAAEELFAGVTLRLDGCKLRKLFWEDLVYLLTLWGHVFLWRGGWNLNARYVIADPRLGGWVNMAVGTVLLMSLQLFSYVSACGCVVDGAEAGRDAVYPTKYLRHYLLPRLEGKKKETAAEPPLEGATVSTVNVNVIDSTGCLVPATSSPATTPPSAANHPANRVFNFDGGGVDNMNFDLTRSDENL